MNDQLDCGPVVFDINAECVVIEKQVFKDSCRLIFGKKIIEAVVPGGTIRIDYILIDQLMATYPLDYEGGFIFSLVYKNGNEMPAKERANMAPKGFVALTVVTDWSHTSDAPKIQQLLNFIKSTNEEGRKRIKNIAITDKNKLNVVRLTRMKVHYLMKVAKFGLHPVRDEAGVVRIRYGTERPLWLRTKLKRRRKPVFQFSESEETFHSSLVAAVKPINGFVFSLQFGKILMEFLKTKNPEDLDFEELQLLADYRFDKFKKYFSFTDIANRVLIVLPIVFPNNTSMLLMTLPKSLVDPDDFSQEGVQVQWIKTNPDNRQLRTVKAAFVQTTFCYLLKKAFENMERSIHPPRSQQFVAHRDITLNYLVDPKETYSWMVGNVKQVVHSLYRDRRSDISKCMFTNLRIPGE